MHWRGPFGRLLRAPSPNRTALAEAPVQALARVGVLSSVANLQGANSVVNLHGLLGEVYPFEQERTHPRFCQVGIPRIQIYAYRVVAVAGSHQKGCA